MRVIESPIDGEVVSADTDDELVRALRRHIEAHHPDSRFTDDQLLDMVERTAYDAVDS
jgi:predicted small metal-binding protein